MKKLLYVGHHYHEKTSSTKFLKELLSQEFEVTSIGIDFEKGFDDRIFDNDYDYVYILQLDFLAPFFIARGCPTIVSPMYDGSASMPLEHWYISKQARYVNFSLHIHNKVQNAGAESLLVKYFLNPNKFEKVEDFNFVKGFIWQRRPEEGLNWQLFHKLLGHNFDALHIHHAPDIPENDVEQPFPLNNEVSYPVTQSTWFESKADFTAVLENSNIYLAPRPSEGIGMGFLEAMARGMVIIANDAPTHSEYLRNWINGVMINKEHVSPLNVDKSILQSLSDNARSSAEIGYKNWLLSQRNIIDFVKSTPSVKVNERLNLGFFVEQLIKSYQQGYMPYYNFLRSENSRLPMTILAELDSSYNYIKGTATPSNYQASISQKEVRKEIKLNESIYFGRADARQFMKEGWLKDEDTLTWIGDQEGVLEFKLTIPKKIKSIAVYFSMRSLGKFVDQESIEIRLNEHLLKVISPSHKFELHKISDIPTSHLLTETPNRLYFRCVSKFKPFLKKKSKLIALRELTFK